MAAESGTAAALAALAAKYGWAAKLVGIFGAGVVGALLIAAVDPAEAMPDPKQRRKLILVQVTSAGVMSWAFTKPAVRFLDHYLDWINLAAAGLDEWLEFGLPVALLIGAMSWGLLGALVKLRAILRDRGAQAVADKTGLGQ